MKFTLEIDLDTNKLLDRQRAERNEDMYYYVGSAIISAGIVIRMMEKQSGPIWLHPLGDDPDGTYKLGSLKAV